MATIGIIGSGNVGANTAFFLAEKAVGDVLLYDLQDGIAKGKALDMMEAAPIRNYQTKIRGADGLDEIIECDIIIVAAGAVRKPGMHREDLFEANRAVIGELAGKLKSTGGIVIMVTEPVDFLTTLFATESGLPQGRVMGLGGLLDSTRLRYLIAEELSVSTENVSALVIGRHADSMIPLPSYTNVSGIPVELLISRERLAELFKQTREAGGLIVELAERASAYYGPSAVASDLAEAIVRDSRRILSVSLMFDGYYSISGVAMSLPAVIGRSGVVRVLQPKLTKDQEKALVESSEVIKSVLARRSS